MTSNHGPVDVIALAIRRRIPDFAMPKLMAWDIERALEEAGYSICLVGRKDAPRVRDAL